MIRWVLGLSGVGMTAYGLMLLVDRGTEDLPEVLTWLVGGVLLHDAVLAPAVLLVAAAGRLVLPRVWQGPVLAGGVVLGSVTLLAVPVLGRFGARPDNPTLLDRDYAGGWLVLAALTALGVCGLVLRARRGSRDG